MAHPKKTVAIIGAGPAGLIAAQRLSQYDDLDIHIFDQKPSVARKFLLAGRGGLNLTHSEPRDRFVQKYDENSERFSHFLDRFSPQDMISWAYALGIKTFKGSSGRIFPEGLKATPLLRAWLRQLDRNNVHFHLKHSWRDLAANNRHIFLNGDGQSVEFTADASIFAMGGASYPHMGSDGVWQQPLKDSGLKVAPLKPANCGFKVAWTEHFRAKFEGAPLKNVNVSFNGVTIAGDLVITKTGLEGGPIYALSKRLRRALETSVPITIDLDLKKSDSLKEISQILSTDRGKSSLSNFLRKKLHLSPIKISLLYEFASKATMNDPESLATTIKSLPITIVGINAITRAISSAGGVKFNNLNERLMVKDRPGLFFAGEMLDWEAPTGGYLLQGTFATGIVAADGVADYLSVK